MVDKVVFSDQLVIKNYITQYYQYLFIQITHLMTDNEWYNFFSSGPTIYRRLERPFEEVHKVIHCIASDNAPIPDDFTIGFFQVCRNVIKEDLMWVFQDFHTNAIFEKKES